MMKYGAKVSKATDLRTLESGREWSESPSFESPLSLSESVEVKMLVWEMTRASDARAKAQEAASSPAAAASVELGASPPPLQLVTPLPDDDAPLPVFAKSAEQRARLGASTRRVLIFRQLSPAQYEAVLDAMFERRVSAGETVIRQGDEVRRHPARRYSINSPACSLAALATTPSTQADNFYVVESGEFDVFVAKPGQAPRMVMSYVSGGTFGELALLSGAKRAATVVAGPREGALWALGRTAFTRVLVDATRRQRAQYEKFLAPLPFLAGLDAYDRGAMADCLADVVYADGEAVISEGEKGDAFFIVLEGSAAALMRDDSEAGVKETMVYSAGMYFGEMALLRNEPRKATVVARGRLKCARMVVEDFRRILARPLSRMLEERRAGRGAGNERFVR
jgi:CRP-like cAMP-binding protein